MKTKLTILFLLLTASVYGESIEWNDFYQFDIKVVGDNPLQQFVVTEAVYDHSKNTRLNEINIVDKLGEPLPFDIEKNETKVTLKRREVDIYPLNESKYLRNKTDSMIFKYDGQDRLSKISKSNGSFNSEVVGYLIDLGENPPGYNQSLMFQLSSVKQTSLLNFDLDQSDNLKDWRTASRGEVLAQLYREGLQSQRNRIGISQVSSRYLRIKLLSKEVDFDIKSVALKYSTQQAPKPIWGGEKLMSYDPDERAFLVEVPQSMNINAIQLMMPNPSTFFSGKLYSRLGENSSWNKVSEIDFFNVQKESNRAINNTLAFKGLRSNQIKIVADFENVVDESSALKIRFAWQPQKVIFLTNGNPPYRLNVGMQGVKKENSQHNQPLLSKIRKQLGGSIELATLSKAQKIERKIIIEKNPIDWSKIALWSILVFGVLFMLWMARRLMIQVK